MNIVNTRVGRKSWGVQPTDTPRSPLLEPYTRPIFYTTVGKQPFCPPAAVRPRYVLTNDEEKPGTQLA
jgi:hypothetical protein